MSLSWLSHVLSACRSLRFGARAGLVQVTLAAVLWGTTGVAVQLICDTTSLSAVSIGFYRLAFATVVLLLFSAHRLSPLLAAFRSTPWTLILVGVGLGAYQATYFISVTLAGVSVATVVSLGLAPVLTTGWEATCARRLPPRSTVGTLTAGIAGLVLITVSSSHSSTAAPRPLLGLLAAVASGLGYAATTVLSRHVAQQVGPRELTTISTAFGALSLSPLALISGAALPNELEPLGLLAYLGVVTTAGAYALFYAGLRTTSGSSAAVLTLLEPLTAAVLAVAVLSEALPLLTVAGGALLLCAIAALYRTQPASTAPLPASRSDPDATAAVP